MQLAALGILLYHSRRHEADGDAESRRPGDFLPIMNMDDRNAAYVARTSGCSRLFAPARRLLHARNIGCQGVPALLLVHLSWGRVKRDTLPAR